MEDSKIIELYFERDESAITETRASYGRLLFSIAMGILDDRLDSEDCENDTYIRTWESIPPTRPTFFSAYLSSITRNLAFDKLRSRKRGRPLGTEIIFTEVAEAIPDSYGDVTEEIELRDALNSFLDSIGKTKRIIFMKRYFFMRSVGEIAKEMKMSESSVKVTLFRVRKELRDFLESRGIVV